MSSVITHGGIDTSVIGFTDVYVYSTSVPLPSGRVAFDGTAWARVIAMAAYASGRGGSRQIGLQITGGVGSTSAFTRASAGSAGYTGQHSCSFLTHGGTGTFEISADGSFYFGRGGSGNTTDNNGVARTDGALYSEMYYVQVPSVPLTPAVSSPAAGQATVTWATPADDGGDTITGYHVQYATNAGFTTGVGSVDVGVVTSTTISGLTPGATYYFRVMAKNATSTAASTYGPATSAVSAVLGAAPDAPTTLASSLYGTTVDLTWAAGASDGGIAVDSYKIDVATDSGFTSIVQTVILSTPADLSKTITKLAAGTTYYVRVYAHNTVGYSSASSSINFAVAARTALLTVAAAEVSLAGVQVELRSDAAQPPVITLGYSALTDGTSFTSIATIATDAGAGTFRAEGLPQALALVADASGNLIVLGVDDGNPNAILAKRFAKGSGNSWTAAGQLSQALTTTANVLAQIAAAYAPGSGGTPIPSVLLIARRAGNIDVGNLSYATLDLTALANSTGSLFLASGNAPSWLPVSPATGKGQRQSIDVAALASGSITFAILANGPSVVTVTNGVVAGVAKSADGTNGASAGTWARALGVSAAAFAVLAYSSGNIVATFYNAANLTVLGTTTILGTTLQGGAAGSNWDAYYDRAAQLIRVYYVTDEDARKIGRVDISASTYAAAAEAIVTSTLGSTSSTNGRMRVPRGAPVDERRILLEAANLLSGAYTLASIDDRVGEITPGAPTLSAHADFDAVSAATFAWTFADSNPFDAQTAFQVIVEKVSDGSGVYDSGKITSATSTRTVAGGTFTNGTAYRWKVRTYDALDTASAYSSYGTFTATSNGTLTITYPSADDPVGYDSSSVALVWTYSQTDGYTQASRRVRVLLDSDGSVLSDTTMQTNTTMGYTVTGLTSGVRVRLEVSITNTHGTVITATRYLTPDYSSPMTPTAVLTVTDDGIQVDVTNPAPTGSRPEVVANWIMRRAGGTSDPYVRVGIIGYNGAYTDHEVAAGKSYDYQIVGSTT